MTLNEATMRATIVVRREPSEVFPHLVDPELTTKFWFDRSTGPLAPDTLVRWIWSSIPAHADLEVVAVDAPRRIAYDWGETRVAWLFEPHPDGTLVTVEESGFTGSDEEIAAVLVETTSGHTKVLCALKAMVEHGVDLRIVTDQ